MVCKETFKSKKKLENHIKNHYEELSESSPVSPSLSVFSKHDIANISESAATYDILEQRPSPTSSSPIRPTVDIFSSCGMYNEEQSEPYDLSKKSYDPAHLKLVQDGCNLHSTNISEPTNNFPSFYGQRDVVPICLE